jgi:hypothetical protein
MFIINIIMFIKYFIIIHFIVLYFVFIISFKKFIINLNCFMFFFAPSLMNNILNFINLKHPTMMSVSYLINFYSKLSDFNIKIIMFIAIKIFKPWIIVIN